MTRFDSLLAALDELRVAREVSHPHDAARLAYSLRVSTVRTFDEFSDVIGDYCSYHFTRCVTRGGSLPKSEAASRAKRILEREYAQRYGGNIKTAFYDARDGVHGGLGTHLNIIADALKAESEEAYTREMFDRHVSPVSWEERVEIIRHFLKRYGAALGPTVQVDAPERYADNYEELIRAFVAALRHAASAFRRI